MEPIPFKPAEDLATLLGPALVVAVLLLAAAAVALVLARRGGRPFAGVRQPRRLKLVERLMLSRRAALWLVEVDGRTVLLGESGERLTRLDIPDPGGQP